MRLSELSNEETVGKKYRRKAWGWRDGPSDHSGYAYVNTRREVRFISNRTSDYNYGYGSDSDWFEVDDRGYPIPPRVIVVGGE